MLKNIFRDKNIKIGEGTISGYTACFLALLSFLGVIAFHFPQYLTTPELRESYDTEFIRHVMFVALVISGSLGLLNFVRNKNKRLGAFAWVFILITISLGAHQVEVGDFQSEKYYLGLDWFILDLLGSTLIFIFIEKLIPHKKEQIIFRDEWKGDLNHFFINHLIIGFVLLLTNQFVHKGLSWMVNEELQAIVNAMPFVLQIFTVILAADLFQYFTHRAYHEIPLFWRFHGVHHSAKKMDWLAGSRQHILELIVTRCFVLAPIFLLGYSKAVIDIYVIIVGLQAVFNHANVKINFGWLQYIIVTPQFHHWHHSSDRAAIDRNYAAHFSFIDYLLGTAVKGQKEWPEEYGVVGDYMPVGMWRQQLFPFRKND